MLHKESKSSSPRYIWTPDYLFIEFKFPRCQKEFKFLPLSYYFRIWDYYSSNHAPSSHSCVHMNFPQQQRDKEQVICFSDVDGRINVTEKTTDNSLALLSDSAAESFAFTRENYLPYFLRRHSPVMYSLNISLIIL